MKNKIELGTNKPREGWTTIDRVDGADIKCELSHRIPLDSNSVDVIYCSHFLEHFNYNQCIKILNECKRILKPNGQIMVSVPNARLWIEAYIFDKEVFINQTFYHDTKSKIDRLNFIAYLNNGQHKNMFDQESLINTLNIAGFKNCRKRDFDPTLDNRKDESIFAIAEK